MKLGASTMGGTDKGTSIAMVIVHSFRSLQDSFEARASEWALTCVILSLGVVFLLNETMFYGPSFSGLRSMVNSQPWWAFMFLVIGFGRLSVLLINGAYWRTPHFRALGAFFCAGIWFVLCMGFLRNGSLMAAIMPWVFFLDVYNVKRASREAGKSEFIQHYRQREGKNAGSTGSHP